jgi:hypothetical protein
MTKLFLSINSILLLIAIIVAYYIVFKTNPTESPYYMIWILLSSFIVIIWSIAVYIGYFFRLFLLNNILKNKDSSYILNRSERQGFLLGLLFSIQLALQGFLLFNILSATILIIAVFLLEFFFIIQEQENK